MLCFILFSINNIYSFYIVFIKIMLILFILLMELRCVCNFWLNFGFVCLKFLMVWLWINFWVLIRWFLMFLINWFFFLGFSIFKDSVVYES